MNDEIYKISVADIVTYKIAVADWRDAWREKETLKAKIDADIEDAIQSAVAAIADRFDIAIAVRKS